VIGFDDIQMSALTHPSLTTVRQPMQLLGEAAVTLLFDRLQTSNGLTRHEVLDTKLVVRQSCGCPIRSDPNP
jgi:LacI family transcriptional regulator